jgi:hypothetical protein
VNVNEGGGFGSKFQLVAGHFAAAIERNLSILVHGNLNGYTANEACQGKGWHCFFEPVSSCQGFNTK